MIYPPINRPPFSISKQPPTRPSLQELVPVMQANQLEEGAIEKDTIVVGCISRLSFERQVGLQSINSMLYTVLTIERQVGLFLHAASYLKKRYTGPLHVHFMLVGDGPARTALEQLAASLQLGAKEITFVGSVPYDRCSLLIAYYDHLRRECAVR
jgi:glycosyltransferase involved in cell wall biosynthesis